MQSYIGSHARPPVVAGEIAKDRGSRTFGRCRSFKSNWDNRGVPSGNTDKDKTLASMQRISDVLDKEKAQLWINHDKAQRDALKMAPGFYD